jgi:hypothetical protein
MTEEVSHETPEANTEVPQVDLSAVPERHRPHVDVEKYQSDENYKRAIDHGYKPKEVWLEDGGEEDMYETPKMFNKRYDDRQKQKQVKSDNKVLADQLSRLQQSVEVIQKGFENEKSAAVQKAVAEAEARFRQAKENGDVDAAVQARDDLNNLKAQQPQQRQAVDPLPVRRIRAEVEEVNPDSEKYNQDLDKAWSDQCVKEAQLLVNTLGRTLTLDEVKTIAIDALEITRKKMVKTETKSPPMVNKPNVTPTRSPRVGQDERATYDALLRSDKVRGKARADSYLKSIGKTL